MTIGRRILGVCAGVAIAVVVAGSAPGESALAAPPDPLVRVVAAADDDLPARAAAVVSGMTLRQKAAAVVMGHIPTTDAAILRDYMQTTGIGGFLLMGANIPEDESALRGVTAALTLDAGLPPLIAIDQEGGDVSRLPWDAFPSALTLKNQAPAAAAEAFAGRGALVQRAGIGVNFGVVADVTDDPSMFIYRRALGTTPETALERVAAAVTGEDGQALTTLKHFPGHGAAPGDSHAGIPSTDETKADWSATDAAPFQAGIDAGAPMLMFGHLVYTAVDAAPATLSPEWHRIARDELGFEGVIVTDDLGMLEASGIPEYQDPVANAVRALAAGSDLLLTVLYSTAGTAPRIVDGIVAAVESGAVPPERLDEAARRVTALRLEVAASGRGLVPCADCTPAG
ncbi:glycoside hydrolase family 3 N-terminal domain-containing protein [Microbacterium sp. SS28]|uniref:glycoside hydrolase family 3 N-terminal domain-containing protein n=1 Tax=Microbacterium sp. SS28 TaxID=2919948 RepID=UPI001FAB1CC8|nr:glycoside hydrolase family 3 N-terminal domain-containing protein [Microbacterium sp. SS28]